MKKILIFTVALALVLSLCACGKTVQEPAEKPAEQEKTPEAPAGIPNPAVPKASLGEINEALGCNLVSPGVMGISDEAFAVINDTLGQYNFSVAGVSYSFRFADQKEDISGIYAAGGTLLQSAEDGQVVSADGNTGARWFTDEGQYCLTTGGEVSEETFKAIVEEIMSIQNMDAPGTEASNEQKDSSSESWYENLAGDWQDTYSGRAMMTVENCSDHAHITVAWGDSASCTYEWIMNVTMGPEEADGTNRLSYKDGVYRKVENDGKTETVTVIYENGEGWFTLNQGGFLLWDGAVEDNCTECVFEKMM